MAAWLGISLGLAGLIVGFAVAAWLGGIANGELAARNWELIRECRLLREEIARRAAG